MSRSTRRTPDEVKVRRVNAKQRPLDWRDLISDDLTDVPDLLFTTQHEVEVTPINKGVDGWRSECPTCGTVLACFTDKFEAIDHASDHGRLIYVG